jgi:hypothetical protein
LGSLALALLAVRASAQDCSHLAFRGFDSRLSPIAVARVPLNRRVTAFEAFQGKLFLGLGSDFVVADTKGSNELVSVSASALGRIDPPVLSKSDPGILT